MREKRVYADGSRALDCIGGPMCGKRAYVKRGETTHDYRAGAYVLRPYANVFPLRYSGPLAVLILPVMLWQQRSE